ncbi:hypothetical protein BDV32DRAFT_47013 [Aspergillus pseudonomiae]|nr:hypothetical protein BDV32DRAFT_47013 [Aspergillus pseudonomiae]
MRRERNSKPCWVTFILSILFISSILILLLSRGLRFSHSPFFSGCTRNVRDTSRKSLAGTTADEAERGRLTLSSVPFFTIGHRVSFSWLVMVDIHLVGRIVSGKVRELFLDRPMYAIFIPALARKGTVFGGFVPFLLWFYFVHLIDFRILEYFF